MARSHINNWLFIGPFSRDYKVYSKSYFKVIIVVLIGIAFGFTKSYSRPVDSLMVKKAAGTFIKSKFRGHQVASVSELKNNDHRTIGYLVNLKPSGFVVLSNDTEIYPIIYYSKKGKFDLKKSNQNIPLDFVKWDLQARERSIAQIKYKQTLSRNSTTWNNYLSGSGVSVQSNTQNTYGPLLTTKWNQNGFYAQYCPTDPKTNNRSYAGCVAAAASQILDYWQFPKKMTFNTADNYTSKGDDGNIAIPGDAGKYNFPTFSTLNSQLSSIKYDGSQTEIGYLEFGVGIKLRMGYSSKGSGAFQSAKFYRKLGYGSANRASWSTSYDKVVTNIKEGWPVQVAIDNGSEGHSVVFDGYDPSNSSFHVNMGWSGIDNGWYIPPYLDTPYKFHSMDDVVYNISPYAGWGQWGADAKNTQRTYYSMPEQNVSKWSVKTKLDRYSSKGLIVNKSSNVIVSNQPMDLKQSNHPSIMVIGPDGVKKSETYLTNENETITYPVQSHTGTIYVGTGTGRIYSINPNANSSKLIFQDPNQKEINNNLKIDSDGIIYATTMNNLYCINSNGNELWNLPAPSNCTYGINSPAIDVARNKVYLAYFNSSNNSSTLLTIDRLNGQILNQKTFSNINSPVTGIGTVSISKNGKVYFGVKTKLEELDPTNNYSLNTLYNNKYGLIINPPAIGKNGALYFSFWQNTKWYNVISLNPTNNSINWTIPIPSSNIGQYGSVSNIYVDNNYHICITIDYHNSNNEYYTLKTYKISGTSVSLLWSRNIGDWGGFVAFGPNNTTFYSNGNQVTAISKLPKGQSTFPNYTNDNPPNPPTYSSPNDNTSSVDTSLTFSWVDNDPDNNSLTYTFYIGKSTQMLNIYQSGLTKNTITISGLQPDSTYLWSVVASDGQASTHGPIWKFKTKSGVITGVVKDINKNIPAYFNLSQNYPNPFNPTTEIKYALPKAENVRLQIFNTLGQLVYTIVNKQQTAGYYQVQLDASKLSSGLYLYRLQAGKHVITKKMILLK